MGNAKTKTKAKLSDVPEKTRVRANLQRLILIEHVGGIDYLIENLTIVKNQALDTQKMLQQVNFRDFFKTF